ncbi:hypothetical protein GCM10008961_29570 [Deinococcus knuensis]|uniref:Uncharacterized protein n=1 Tax=Deinococcus knuensis TaxID=1837380 RepID=A0ABQ2SPI7_9DEIO|nr:hypothetical protein GCM10008961_29570 [Deinococcus knuensis]
MGCKARSIRAKRVGAGRVPDVEPAGAVKFRIVGETNGSPYKDARRGEAGLSAGSASRFYVPPVVRGVRIGRVC